jgi:hypothetical protein
MSTSNDLRNALKEARFPAPIQPIQTVKAALIPVNSELHDYLDLTFDTDAVAALVSGSIDTRITAVSSSINTTIGAVSSSINTTIGAVSSSTNTTINALSGSTNTTINALSASVSATYITSASMVNTLTSFIVFGGLGGGYVNDAAAASAGVPVGGLYHTTGTVKVRLV